MSTKHDSTHHPTAPAATGFSPAFAALGLEASLLATLETLGYEEPTPIQREAIPPLLTGRDLLGQAATGTGKTAAFTLPLLQRIAHGSKAKPSALILVPTRELAIQVGEAVQRYGKELRTTVLAVYGGQAIGPQFQALRRGVDVIVATPGRALDHIRRGTLKLAQVQTVVLDEADEMLDMGFADDLVTILEQTPSTKQTALFSATMPPRIKSIAHRHLKNPVEITIAKEAVKAGAAPRVQQTAYVVTRQHRGATLARIIDMAGPKSALVFCRTRLEVDEVTAMLSSRGHRAEAIHGGMSQVQRDRVMNAFKTGQTELLVATDVAARGLDIPQVSHVINYDLPSSAEVYVHRIGRTGRAGREGAAVTILDPREQRLLRSIELHTKSKVTVAPVPSVADLRTKRLERTKAAVKEAMEAGDLDRFTAVAEALASTGDPMRVAAAAMKLIYRAQGGERAEQEIPALPTRVPEPYRPMQRQPQPTGQHPGAGQRPGAGDRPRRLIMRPGERPPAGRPARGGG
ncbi:MAG: DEAD/DEAH box helicase, partial [Candidatus Sericytochromatia bacterium]|nr:DEAD/DEAH box helicase [Candidatus Tanganyikabacteria bacterium]